MERFSNEFLQQQRGRIEERISRYLSKERIADELLAGEVSPYTDYKQTVLIPILKKALIKLTSGNYGICESCGGEIELVRLEIVPGAENCIKCMK